MKQGNRRDHVGGGSWNPGALILRPFSLIVKDLFQMVQERMAKFKKTITFGGYHRISRSASHAELERNRYCKVPAEHPEDTKPSNSKESSSEESPMGRTSYDEGGEILNPTDGCEIGLKQLIPRPLGRMRFLPPGLCNHGNLCFLNSTLQALASLPSFVASVNLVSKNTSLINTSPISSTLSNVLKLLNFSSPCADMVVQRDIPVHHPKAVDPAALASLIRKHQHHTSFQTKVGSIFGIGGILQEQQDAQEMLQALIQALSDECNALRTRRSLTLSDVMAPPPPQSLSASLSDLNISPSSVIGGWHGTSIECQRCHSKRPISNVPFISVTLPLSELPDCAVSIESCVGALTKSEWLREVECDRCTVKERIDELETSIAFLKSSLEMDSIKCNLEETKDMEGDLSEQLSALSRLKAGRWHDTCLCGKMCARSEDCLITPVRSSVCKRLLFTRLPPVLILHMNRQEFCPHTGSSRKSKKKVMFELELDMSPFCAFGGADWRSVSLPTTQPNVNPLPSARIMYDLCAVIQHHGGTVGGHYTTYRKVMSSDGGSWVHASDLDVEEVGVSRVLGCEPYLLFYERRS